MPSNGYEIPRPAEGAFSGDAGGDPVFLDAVERYVRDPLDRSQNLTSVPQQAQALEMAALIRGLKNEFPDLRTPEDGIDYPT